jgi:hypothetical protein
LKYTLRSLFAVLAAALAFAGAGAGIGAGAARDEAHSAQERREHQVERVAYALPATARVLLRGGVPLLDGRARRTGAPPRIAGTDPSDDDSFATRTVDRRSIAARARGILSLPLARRLAAARDGTVSSHSNGVPPPVSA